MNGRFVRKSFVLDIDMAHVMLNHLERHCYYNPVGMQYITDEDDEATSHPIERVPSQFSAAAGREIVDVDTLEQKAIPCQSMLRRVGHGSFNMIGLIRPV